MTDDDDLTADEMFGTTPPGTPVPSTLKDRAPGRPAPRFRYRRDGRPIPLDDPREELETELPDEYCPDGSPRCARRDGRRTGVD